LKGFLAARGTGREAHQREAAAMERSKLELVVGCLELRFLVQEEHMGEVVPWENGLDRWNDDSLED
jgi:hypothetical protein